MIVKDQIRGKADEWKQSRVPQKIARGQNAAGALRTKHPIAAAKKEAFEVVQAKKQPPQPSAENLDAVRLIDALKALENNRDVIKNLAKTAQDQLEQTKKVLSQNSAELSNKHEIDKTIPSTEDVTMNAQSIELIDAKLEAIESRMDGRVASIEGKIDAMLARFEESGKANDQRAAHMEQRFAGLEDSFKEVRDASRNMKYWLAGTVVAIVVGVYAANISMVQTMIAAFDSGKDTAAAQAEIRANQDEIKRQASETASLIDQLKRQAPAK